MRFCLSWLRELCPLEQSVGEVADALTSRGLTVDSVEPHGDDHVLDVDVPANRPDCLGHLGVARELSAASGLELQSRPAPAATGEPTAVRVEIEEPELCRRYTAGVARNVHVGPSPAWVAHRLEACGVRGVQERPHNP